MVAPNSRLLTAEEVADLRTRGRVRRYPRGATLFQEGDRSESVAYVLEGRVKVSSFTGAGTEVLLAVHGAGQLLGELLTPATTWHMVTANTPCCVGSRHRNKERKGVTMALRMRTAKHEMLASVPLFAGCTPHEISLIESIADEAVIEEGRELVREGRYGGEFFIVVEGTATATRHGDPLATFGPGSFFGEMALLDGGVRTATVTAATPMRVLVLDPRSFTRLVDETPTVARAMMRTLSERLRRLEEIWI